MNDYFPYRLKPIAQAVSYACWLIGKAYREAHHD